MNKYENPLNEVPETPTELEKARQASLGSGGRAMESNQEALEKLEKEKQDFINSNPEPTAETRKKLERFNADIRRLKQDQNLIDQADY